MSKRTRIENWDVELLNWLNDFPNLPVVWGEFDCVSGLCLGAVLVQTGFDFEASVPVYKTEKEALLALKSFGGPTKMMDTFLKRTKRKARGNIVQINKFKHPAFGVRVGTKVACLNPSGGLVYIRPSVNAPEWSVVN